MRGKSRCEDCQFFDYDEEIDSNYCTQDLDEDEMERFLRAAADACPCVDKNVKIMEDNTVPKSERSITSSKTSNTSEKDRYQPVTARYTKPSAQVIEQTISVLTKVAAR